jgi:hypothetical protein
MRQEPIHLDVSDSPELASLAEDVQTSGQARVLTRDGQALAVVMPAAPQPKTKPRLRRRAKPIPPDDPIFDIIGMVRTGEPSNVAANKKEYLAQAYYEEFHPADE